MLWIWEASLVDLDCTTPKAPRRDGGGEEKCTRDDLRFIGPDPHCELAKHERKTQGMKLATAPLLCDPFPWTSLTPRCAPPSHAFTPNLHPTSDLFASVSTAGQPSGKLQIMPFNVCQCAVSSPRATPTYTIVKYFGEDQHQMGLKYRLRTDVYLCSTSVLTMRCLAVTFFPS